MAGGLGKRLRPLTENCPKPLLKVGTRPLLETTVMRLKECGFSNIFISVNYMAEKVVDHFGDGHRFGVKIHYLYEDEPLGTAGSLSKIPKEHVNLPLLVMNGDLLTKVNFTDILNFHDAQNSIATMCVRQYSFEVPYGVVKLDRSTISRIDEKPVNTFFVNAGIYVLNPSILQMIPDNRVLDMPSLFNELMSKGDNISAFPIHEYWLDIGKKEDFSRANNEYPRVFA